MLVCDMCYYMPGKLIVLFVRENFFRICQGKVNSFKEVRGRSNIPGHSPKFNFGETCFVGKILFQEIKRQADIGFRIRSILSTLYIHRINSCNKWVERMAVMGTLCSGQTGRR